MQKAGSTIQGNIFLKNTQYSPVSHEERAIRPGSFAPLLQCNLTGDVSSLYLYTVSHVADADENCHCDARVVGFAKKTLVLATTHTANIYYDVLLFASVICLFCSYKHELNARRKEELDNSDTNEYLAPIRALEYFQCCMFTSCVFISKNALWILLWFLWYILYIIYMYDA